MNDTTFIAAQPFAPAPTLPGWPYEPDLGDIRGFLDRAADWLGMAESIPAVWGPLIGALSHLQKASGDPDWHRGLRDHRIMDVLHEEPASAWAFRRPRGYAGDAHLIDFLYEHEAVDTDLAAASHCGRTMNAMIMSCLTPVAVQERRRLLARLLDATAARVPGAEALVLACGHFREAALASSLGGFSRIVALDQDSASVAEMRRCYADLAPLIPVEASIGRMIVRPLVHGRFDLIYAAGLYDYLDDSTAIRLTTGMFSALKPRGRLMFANFCTGVPDYGYMDAFMDWRLLQRDEPEMQRLIDALPADEAARVSLFRGQNRATIYALIEKR
jgi:hypothetical protein